MPAEFELTTETTVPDLDRLLAKLRPDQLAAVMKIVGVGGQDLVRESFQTSKTAYGEKWAPLQESTLEAFVGRGVGGKGGRRRRKSYGTRPLVRMGTLMSSATSTVTLDGSAVKIGVSKAYGVFHQGDPDVPSKGIVPERSFLPKAERGLPDAWRVMVVESIEAHLGGG